MTSPQTSTASTSEVASWQTAPAAPSRRRRCALACGNCKRRKERCDGEHPCQRCVSRNVPSQCRFGKDTVGDRRASINRPKSHNKTVDVGNSLSQSPLSDVLRPSSATSIPQTSRIIQDAKGKFMFIGDSANLSLLQDIRRMVSSSIGPCPFVDDPSRYVMVEAAPEGKPSWLHAGQGPPPPQPSLSDATYLIRRYILATNCVLDLFDEFDLLQHLPAWLSDQHESKTMLSPIYYLVLAIGAQTAPDDKDSLAEVFFNYGRYLTALEFMEDPSIPTVQAYALITMYLLNAARRNAAFMYLGIAVRAAYALGLQRSDVAMMFSTTEFQMRERLWKVIRILDLFMSASMGRPPSTSETRETESGDNYSTSNDLCAIFEAILVEIYAKRMVSTETLEKISQHHRRWTARIHEGLATDKIDPQNALDGGTMPNIGLLHVKAAYYWTVMLLTRPFFVEFVSLHISEVSAQKAKKSKTDTPSTTSNVLAHASVDSAVRSIDLLKILLNFENIPKRLPFVVNSIFVSALVLGLGYFGDLYKIFPLEQGLMMAERLLALFPSDPVAQRHWNIVSRLRDACSTYLRQKAKLKMLRQSQLVQRLFGHLDGDGEQDIATRATYGTLNGQHQPNNLQNLNYSTADTGTQLASGTGSNALHNTPSQANFPQDGTAYNMMNQSPSVSRELNGPTSSSYYPSSDVSRDDFDFSSVPLVMSPRTLWFASYEETNPLFTMDQPPNA